MTANLTEAPTGHTDEAPSGHRLFRLPQRGTASGSLRAVGLLWRRELVKLRRNPLRIALGLIAPLMFLLVFGAGLEAASEASSAGLRAYQTYLFPGVLLMAVQTPAITVGVSIVLDKRTGVMRQMLVAPVRRWSMTLGLCVAGATTGTVYGSFVLAVAGAAGIPYTPRLLLVLVELALVSMAFTAGAMLAAVTIRSVETFQVLMGLLLMPMMFLSGAMFPPNGLPGWLGVAIQVNPLTYVVDALRRTLPGDAMVGQAGPTLWGWSPPVALEVGFVAAVTLAAVLAATRRLNRSE